MANIKALRKKFEKIEKKIARQQRVKAQAQEEQEEQQPPVEPEPEPEQTDENAGSGAVDMTTTNITQPPAEQPKKTKKK